MEQKTRNIGIVIDKYKRKAYVDLIKKMKLTFEEQEETLNKEIYIILKVHTPTNLIEELANEVKNLEVLFKAARN